MSLKFFEIPLVSVCLYILFVTIHRFFRNSLLCLKSLQNNSGYEHNEYMPLSLNPYSAGVNFSRQNLTSIYVSDSDD